MSLASVEAGLRPKTPNVLFPAICQTASRLEGFQRCMGSNGKQSGSNECPKNAIIYFPFRKVFEQSREHTTILYFAKY